VITSAGTGEEGGSTGADAEPAPSAGTRLVDVNLDPPFPNAPGSRAVSLLADKGFTERFRPRVVSTTLAVAWVAAGRRAAYVTDRAAGHDQEPGERVTWCKSIGHAG
jgi:myo-inositol-1(or 4)-monophosphatase